MSFSAAGFFEQSLNPMFALDPEGIIIAANSAALTLFSREISALRGVNLAALVSESSLSALITALAELRQGLSSKFLVTIRNDNGRDQRIEVQATPSTPPEFVYCVARYSSSILDDIDLAGASTGHIRLQEIAREVAATLGTTYSFISCLREWPATRVEVVASWVKGAPGETFEFDLSGTPCEAVISGKLYSVPEGVIEAFPNDSHLPEMGVESYLGVPVKDETGIILGHVCVLDAKTMPPATIPQNAEILRAAARAASRELGRMRAESLLSLGPESTISLEGTSLYHAITRQIAIALQVDIVFASEFNDTKTQARVLSLWNGKNHIEGISYPLENTPCGIVARGEVCQLSAKAYAAFPGNPAFESPKIESCIAVPLIDSYGKILGVLVLQDRRPMEGIEERAFALRLFAGRIASEMERLRAARGAAESDARFRLLVEHAADILLGYDLNGTIRECNRAAEEALGIPREHLLGANLADVRDNVSPEDIIRETSLLKPAIPTTTDTTFRRTDGSTFPAEVRTVLFEHAGNTLAICSARDVTEQRKAAHLLESALLLLQTPIIEAWDGIVALPVIGAVDRHRATKMTLALLNTIADKQAEVAILDLTGVSTVDEETANHLLDIAKAASLLGSDCLVSGITPAVAKTLVDLSPTQNSFKTFATLQSALRHALNQRGIRVSKKNKDKDKDKGSRP